MKLKTKVSKDEFAALPPHYQELYALGQKSQERDDSDKYVLSSVEMVDGYGLEHITGLKNTISTLREEVRETADFMKQFEGLDTKQVLKAYDKFKDANKWTPSEEVQAKIDARVSQLETKHSTALEELKKDNTFLMSEVERVLIDSEVARATEPREDNETAGSFALLIGKVRENSKAEKGPDGKFKAVILQPDRKSTRITEKQGSTDGMSVAEYLRTLKSDPEYARAFDGPKSTGSGETGRLQTRQGTTDNVGAYDPASDPTANIAAYRRSQRQTTRQ